MKASKWLPPRPEHWREVKPTWQGHPIWIGHRPGVYRVRLPSGKQAD